MMEYQGRIVKGIGGFYYVDTADGVLECRARGIFRKEKQTPLVGDMVKISYDPRAASGSVDEILPRKCALLRPPVANVTQIAIVAAVANPKPNLYLLDKLIAAAEHEGIEPILCWNKADLKCADAYAEIYRSAGFTTLFLSAETGENVPQLKELLRGQITVFAGNSGVGKSSLLNRIFEREAFATGAVSQRVERGKHTTRHTELAQIPGGGYIMDTPGFGNLDMSLLVIADYAPLFREFAPYLGSCRFRDCSHTVEKGCSVLAALKGGKIAPSRHESYCRLLQEMQQRK